MDCVLEHFRLLRSSSVVCVDPVRFTTSRLHTACYIRTNTAEQFEFYTQYNNNIMKYISTKINLFTNTVQNYDELRYSW